MIKLPIAELKPVLTGLGKIISKSPSIPVLGMVKVERTKDGWITLTGTDLDSFITARLEEPTNDEPISMLVPYSDLSRISKTAELNQCITLEPKGNRVLIKYPIGNQTGEEPLESLPVDEYPDIPKIKTDAIPISANLRSSLLQAFECTSDDPSRAILHGACIDVSDNHCHTVVGTDGRHLYSSNSFTLPLKESLVIPTNKFMGWKEFVNDGEWQLRVDSDKNAKFIQISSRRYRFITNQIEGKFPNWRQVIPKDYKTSIEFNDDSILNIIPRLPMNPRDKDSVIGLKIEKNKFSLLARNGSDENQTEVEVTGSKIIGNPITVHLNRNFMQKALEFGFKRLEIEDEMTAVRFVGNGKQLIVMPVRTSESPVQSKPTDREIKPESTNPIPVVIQAIEPSTERNQPMSESTVKPMDKPALEQALIQVETMKETFRSAITGLNELSACLKQVSREQKVSEREIHSVRQTLRSLQSVRI